MVQLTVKIIGVGTFRIGEQSPTAGIQVADKESCQQRKRWPVVENLRAKDKRKPQIERLSGKVKQPGLKERAIVHLRINRGKSQRLGLFVGERYFEAVSKLKKCQEKCDFHGWKRAVANEIHSTLRWEVCHASRIAPMSLMPTGAGSSP